MNAKVHCGVIDELGKTKYDYQREREGERERERERERKRLVFFMNVFS